MGSIDYNVIMFGRPGFGKTMLAERLPTILPPITFKEAIETSKIFGVVGLMEKDKALTYPSSFMLVAAFHSQLVEPLRLCLT